MSKLKTHHFWFILLLWILPLSQLAAQDQQLHGRITDENGAGLPFATIHQKNTTNGTTSNAIGFYSLELQRGNPTVVIQFVGYKSVEQNIEDLSTRVMLNVQMQPEVLQLEALVIKPGAEDPAYGIIRNAIAQRKNHLREVQDYQCNVYIKGSQRLDEVPERILGIPVTIDTGIVYLSESVSELSVKQPDKVKEKVISSKVSGDNRAFSFNQASDVLISFYENQIYSEGLSERGFISPIADNAMLFYDYELAGTVQQDGQVINKIKVFPKRSHDPSFSGLVYIVDRSWRLHSVDLLLTKEHQIEFVDSLRIKQLMAPVDKDGEKVWTLLSQQFNFLLNAFGFKGEGYFVGVYTDYSINEGIPSRYFSNEVITVDINSNKKDSMYWEITRPIPLTIAEIEDYHFKDSMQVIKKSEPYLDSIDHKNNKVTPTHIFLTGKTFRHSFKKQSWNFPSLVELFQFNTVEGFVPNLGFSFTQEYEDYRFYRINPEFRYGFSNERFNAHLKTRYYYNPLKFASIRVSAGRFVESLNESVPLTAFDNTFYTLVEEKNFLKIYEKSYFKAEHHSEIVNGFYLTGSLEWSQRRPLENTNDYTFKDRDEREFTPNAPENIELNPTKFPKHQAFLWNLKVKWQPGQKYIKRPYRKFIVKRKYPALTLSYQAVFPDFLGSDLDFQKLSGEISHQFKLGLWGTGIYSLKMGGFLTKDSLSFVDYQHFNGNRTVFGHFEIGNYQLLDYYLYSTTSTFYQGHYEHHFNGFIINKIPLLRKTRIQAVAAAHYLNTKSAGNYWEFGVGVEHIFKVLRIDYYHSWLEGSHQRSGLRLGLGF